jgi:hypothetical protein
MRDVLPSVQNRASEQALANDNWMIVFISDLLISHACPDAGAFSITDLELGRCDFPSFREKPAEGWGTRR